MDVKGCSWAEGLYYREQDSFPYVEELGFVEIAGFFARVGGGVEGCRTVIAEDFDEFVGCVGIEVDCGEGETGEGAGWYGGCDEDEGELGW